jgi:3'-5' exoribonuclease 1
MNLKQQFTTMQKLPQKYGMAQVLKLAKLPLNGMHHRGIDDARNIAKLLPYIMGFKTL